VSALLIDGKAAAAILRQKIAAEVQAIESQQGWTPCLAVILVGEDPASQVYVRNKQRALVEVGMRSLPHHLPASLTEAELLALISKLNQQPDVHGILVQLPLPKTINTNRVLEAIDPAKDVDGFHPVNAGRLACGLKGLVPCTPLGSMHLLRQVVPQLSGRHAVVLGKSNIVGRPMAQLLLQAECTVTIVHSRSRDVPALCRQADILVVAVGKPELVRGDWLKAGAVVIDVGINRVNDAQGKSRLVGDVAIAEAMERAAAITPVPGGVGPMTIACLLQNTLQAACQQRGLPVPDLAEAA
jgi:methylenetetrahydrofolate dehydrogenase (NADP+) / methenyltetrahydrofolate cyclohydrolase